MKDIGQKAKSLLELKKKNLFPKRIVIIPELPRKEDFFKLIFNEGFKEGEDIAVRFSSPSKTKNLPRSIVIKEIEEAYEFIEKNINEDLTAIVQDFVFPEFSGSLLKSRGTIYINLINGAWESGSSENCDHIRIDQSKIIIKYNSEEKECLFVEGKELNRRLIKNEREEIEKVVKEISKKVRDLNLDEDILYEFILTPTKDFVVMEFKKGINFEGKTKISEDLFEIKNSEDIFRWDKKKDLLISMTINRENDLDLIKIIEEIKPYKKEVFVTYGLLSHPAIVLREFGIKTIPYENKLTTIEIDLK